jgi:hypothetical protein
VSNLGSGWNLSGAAVFYWRQSLGDGIYGLGLNLIRASEKSHARYIGTQGDLTLTWDVNRNRSLQAAYSILTPGTSIKETKPPADTVQFARAHVVFRF